MSEYTAASNTMNQAVMGPVEEFARQRRGVTALPVLYAVVRLKPIQPDPRLAEASVLPAVETELVGNLLKAIWHAQEDTGKRVVSAEEVPEFLPNRATFLRMARQGLVRVEAGELSLTSFGEPRATQAIRRHRLAERLLHDTFDIHNDVVDEHALRIEHTLSPQVTEKICVFLAHPRTCPHGSPIPPGVCCRPDPGGALPGSQLGQSSIGN